MDMNRRKFLSVTSAAGVSWAAAMPARSRGATPETEKAAYKYRIAFDVWINDVRNEAMPLENWPYGVFDDKTVDSIVRALDLQAEVGYTIVDLAGFWTTYGWPVDINSVADKDRVRRVNQILRAVHERKMKVITFPCGIMNWGFDEIIRHDPAVRSDDKHNMNPLREESWKWAYKVFDFVADNYDIDGFHLESADQGRCRTKECMEKWPNDAAYHSYVTGRMAEYIRRKHPGKVVIATIMGFGARGARWGKTFTEEEKAHVVKLSRTVDCLIDQGHWGTYVSQADWPEFIKRLHCAYGTSGGLWLYPNQRWHRSRWFLPYAMRTGKHIKELYDAGGRGVMYYQGPVMNPSTEVNIAFGGRLMNNAGRNLEEVLAEVLELLYKPKNPAAHRKLVDIFQRAEDVYFGQWNAKRFLEHEGVPGQQKRPQPGNLRLAPPFGASPGPATYLMDPFLDTEGRRAYKAGLVSLLKDIFNVEQHFSDNGRLGRIKDAIEHTLMTINNIAFSKGEKDVWDDMNVGKLF